MKAIKQYSIVFFSMITLVFSACSLKENKVSYVDIPVENSPAVNDSPETEDDGHDDNAADPSEEVTKDDAVLEGSNAEENLYDEETIREFLAKKYTCTKPPFYTILDHIGEDGIYAYHIYESVVNEDESHTATIDWVYVDPKTGEATTFFGETFYIGETDNAKINSLIEQNVVLSDDEEIEAGE